MIYPSDDNYLKGFLNMLEMKVPSVLFGADEGVGETVAPALTVAVGVTFLLTTVAVFGATGL